jgi:hypothetical protein
LRNIRYYKVITYWEKIMASKIKEDPEAERLWVEEAERRYKEYREGKIKAKPADLVYKEARSKLE